MSFAVAIKFDPREICFLVREAALFVDVQDSMLVINTKILSTSIYILYKGQFDQRMGQEVNSKAAIY